MTYFDLIYFNQPFWKAPSAVFEAFVLKLLNHYGYNPSCISCQQSDKDKEGNMPVFSARGGLFGAVMLIHR